MLVVVQHGDLQASLESAKIRMSKENGTREKIERGELSLDFHGLREVLKNRM